MLLFRLKTSERVADHCVILKLSLLTSQHVAYLCNVNTVCSSSKLYSCIFAYFFIHQSYHSHSYLFCYLPFKLETVHVQCCLYKSIDQILRTLSFLLNLLSIADKLAFNIRTNYMKAVSQVWVFHFNHEIYLSVQYSIM